MLSLVLPVYNEAPTIAASLRDWHATLSRLGVPFEIVVVDDGSRDDTAGAIAGVQADLPEIQVHRQANAGHGAALLAAYRASRGDVIAQIDGDDEIGTRWFDALWEARGADVFVIGRRDAAQRATVRRVISGVASLLVYVFTSRRVHDGNVPYRLIPRALLDAALGDMPPGLFAPNLALTVYAAATGWRIVEVPVVERARVQRDALGGMRLWRGAVRAARETVRYMRRARHQRRA